MSCWGFTEEFEALRISYVISKSSVSLSVKWGRY